MRASGAILLVAHLVLLSASCSQPDDQSVARPVPTRVPSSLLCRTHPPGAYPADLPPIGLPPNATLVDSGATARKGFIRTEMLITGNLSEAVSYFERRLERGRFEIIARERDPHDAEFFFAYGGRPGIILLADDCAGTFAVIEVAKEGS